MHRGAWQATVHGVARVKYDLVTKPPIKESASPVLNSSVPTILILQQQQ